MSTLFKTEKREPNQTVILHFDGGTPCNNPANFGIGYGSYSYNGGKPERVSHGIPCSNNAAEILTLCVALEKLCDVVKPEETHVHVWADSQIAIKWTLVAAGNPSGGYKKVAKISKGSSPMFQSSIVRLTKAVERYSSVTAEWKPRIHAVRAFGH